MKTTALQIFFAEDYLSKAWIATFVLSAVTVMTAYLFPTFAILGISFSSVLLGFSIIVGGAVAYLVSLIAGSCVLPPFYRLRERLNGAPFKKGETVEILKKPYRGRIALVDSPGDSQYGASVHFIDADSNSESAWFGWHSMRRVNEEAEQDVHGNTH
jgi:hypothetical protein